MDEKNWFLVAAVEIALLMIAVSLLLSRPCHEVPLSLLGDLRVVYKPIDSPKDIEPLQGQAIPPIAYTSVIPFSDLDVKIKKKKFFDMMLPAILLSKHKLARLRQRILDCLNKEEPSEGERQWLKEQMKLFDAKNYKQLLRKTDDHPVSIILAQAALESGWGDSRFFAEGNNVFGVWSFDPEEPRVKAGVRSNGQEIYVKKYSSLIESVDDYFLTIARGPYRRFRLARQREEDPIRLISHLTRYSEQRGLYIQLLRNVIEKNNLQRFDSCYLDPRYIVREAGG